MLSTLCLSSLLVGTTLGYAPPTPAPVRTSGPGSRPSRVGQVPEVDGRAAAKSGRAELIDYNPLANPGAVVVDSSGMARFTVLTDRLIRMESISTPGDAFEDRATLMAMNRNLPVPSFTHSEAGGVLTIATSKVSLSYTVGSPFTASTLSAKSLDATSAFTTWSYGQAFPGNLLGTIRGQDGQSATPLNCTVNAGTDDNGEFNHCEWGLVSRDGWVTYNDTINVALDENDWWATNQNKTAACVDHPGYDAINPTNSPNWPTGTTTSSEAACATTCASDAGCTGGYVYGTDAGLSPNCWPLASIGGMKPVADRDLCIKANPAENTATLDLYGFFHGHDYRGAIYDFTQVSGKTIMVPKYTAGIWNSRWFDYSSQDNIKLVEDYASRRIPLDVFVIDMDWHKKNDWSGFTFDPALYPSSESAMAYLKALGLGITVNIHDASGVNSWEAQFPALISALGLDPATTTKVPFNLLNATVAYAVEDIVLGDLVNNQHVDFMWIDWQQGGDAGGMTGNKQNPTFWLNHLRCTDRHRVGDKNRALVLARWGGMGMHRYQVGFSGDVASLSWGNLAYQPYFSATSANVAHGFWSHDIEGPPEDLDMYTRWIQVGAFSGIMRSHDRGMSAGGCNNKAVTPGGGPWIPGCSLVEPWNLDNTYFEANRAALQAREELVPYIYTAQRSAFDTGVGLIIPMYYFFPEQEAAYAMDGAGNSVQYMFGPSILFSPVVSPPTTPNAFGPGLSTKVTWLPPGINWYDTTTGAIIPGGDTTSTGVYHNGTYTLAQIPLFYVGGSVIPYLPLKSLPVLGLASSQYSFLGFKVVPGGSGTGSTTVYEDDGVTTDYLTAGAYAWTTASYTSSGPTTTITVSTNGTYPTLPATRAYQFRVLNGGALASVTVGGGTAVPYNRFGAVASAAGPPPSNQWYWEFTPQQGGMGPVVDIVGVPVGSTPLVVTLTFATPAVDLSPGHYGYIQRGVWAKTNMDLDRSTPNSNSPGPAYLSVLGSTGEAMAHFAGTDAGAFATAANNVPVLVANATVDVAKQTSPRKAFTLELLGAGW